MEWGLPVVKSIFFRRNRAQQCSMCATHANVYVVLNVAFVLFCSSFALFEAAKVKMSFHDVNATFKNYYVV
jgi:D-alanyl-lipoteichoic acid acyltransferase DltB (MBOAT superfamily)